MIEFVEECRSEWKRLGVSDTVADEMAADLAADLEEAAAEGVSAEEVLGCSAFDPRSFAAGWAVERGVIPKRRVRRSRIPAAIAAVALIPAIVGAVLLIRVSPSERQRLAPPLPRNPVVVAQEPAPVEVQGVWVVARDINSSTDGTHTAGSVLLIVGLAGIVISMLARVVTP